MPALITRDDLALVIDEAVTEERFDKLYATSLRIVRTGFDGDPEATTDRTRDVVAAVLFGVMVRIVANPKGARAVAAGSASVTFGGADGDIASIFALTDAERDDLASVSSTGGSPFTRSAFTARPVAAPYIVYPR